MPYYTHYTYILYIYTYTYILYHIIGVNDSIEDAEKLIQFIQPMYTIAPNLMIDLIPYNDINIPYFSRPSRERVNMFQHQLRKQGIFCR